LETRIHACPKCGKRPEVSMIGDAGGIKKYYINCENDKCPFKSSTYGITKMDAIENWNKKVAKVAIHKVPGEELLRS